MAFSAGGGLNRRFKLRIMLHISPCVRKYRLVEALQLRCNWGLCPQTLARGSSPLDPRERVGGARPASRSAFVRFTCAENAQSLPATKPSLGKGVWGITAFQSGFPQRGARGGRAPRKGVRTKQKPRSKCLGAESAVEIVYQYMNTGVLMSMFSKTYFAASHGILIQPCEPAHSYLLPPK